MPKKGKSKNPLGPCMNVRCPHGLNADFRCGCSIENVGEHSIFHPECTASSEADALHRSVGAVFPTPEQLEAGRDHARAKRYDDHDFGLQVRVEGDLALSLGEPEDAPGRVQSLRGLYRRT